eukprot:CFRG7155T1
MHSPIARSINKNTNGEFIRRYVNKSSVMSSPNNLQRQLHFDNNEIVTKLCKPKLKVVITDVDAKSFAAADLPTFTSASVNMHTPKSNTQETTRNICCTTLYRNQRSSSWSHEHATRARENTGMMASTACTLTGMTAPLLDSQELNTCRSPKTRAICACVLEQQSQQHYPKYLSEFSTQKNPNYISYRDNADIGIRDADVRILDFMSNTDGLNKCDSNMELYGQQQYGDVDTCMDVEFRCIIIHSLKLMGTYSMSMYMNSYTRLSHIREWKMHSSSVQIHVPSWSKCPYIAITAETEAIELSLVRAINHVFVHSESMITLQYPRRESIHANDLALTSPPLSRLSMCTSTSQLLLSNPSKAISKGVARGSGNESVMDTYAHTNKHSPTPARIPIRTLEPAQLNSGLESTIQLYQQVNARTGDKVRPPRYRFRYSLHDCDVQTSSKDSSIRNILKGLSHMVVRTVAPTGVSRDSVSIRHPSKTLGARSSRFGRDKRSNKSAMV